VQSQLVRLIEKNYYLNKSGREAYRSYLMAYASHGLKDIFNVHELDLAVRVYQSACAALLCLLLLILRFTFGKLTPLPPKTPLAPMA